MKAFYFSKDDKKLRYNDNRICRTGRTHKFKGEPILCEQGLHASRRLIDALHYAPGSYLWLVELGGEIKEGGNKVVATERKYLGGFNAESLLREFARKQALINIKKIHKYCTKKDYDLIVEYLETGNEDIRNAAWSAARGAADAADAAWSAVDAAYAVDAARNAAWSAADAAWSAAGSAAWSAVDAAYAVDAARGAARSAAGSAAGDMLTDMVRERTGWEI